MYKIMTLILAVTFLLALEAPIYSQMLGPDQLTPDKFKNCHIFHLRKLDKYAKLNDVTDINRDCSAPTGWAPEGHSSLFLMPVLLSLYNAETAYCQDPGCTSTGKDMILMFVGDTMPWIKISKDPKSDTVIITLTTALLDFVQRTTIAILNDAASESEKDPKLREGFKAWLKNLQDLGGKSCDKPVFWVPSGFSGRINAELTMRAAMASYTVIFAHELAHRVHGQNCGYANNAKLKPEQNSLEVEKSCDKIALAQLAKAGIVFPYMVVGVLIAWQHYITLRRPQLESEYPGGAEAFSQQFPAVYLRARATELVAQWEKKCRGGDSGPMCMNWKTFVKEARKFIDAPEPAPCVRK